MFLSTYEFIECSHHLKPLWTKEHIYLENLLDDDKMYFKEKIFKFIEHFSYSVIYRYKIDNLKWSIPFNISAVFDYNLNKMFDFNNFEKLLKNRLSLDIVRDLSSIEHITISNILNIDLINLCLGKKKFIPNYIQ